MRYELTDYEWAAIKPMLPNTPRGVPRVYDRRVLIGRKVASGVRLLVAPASRRDQTAAAREGVMQILQDAGAQILPNACGICAGYGGTLGEGERCLSTTARNFKGRMGPASAEVFLASPYTVAASAVEGRIADPRPYLAEGA
jgi:3-isopropylmalate/(R)-2-methylmalate dehydratase large subunit